MSIYDRAPLGYLPEMGGGPWTSSSLIPPIFDNPAIHGIEDGEGGRIYVGALGDDPMDFLDPERRAKLEAAERAKRYQPSGVALTRRPVWAAQGQSTPSRRLARNPTYETMRVPKRFLR